MGENREAASGWERSRSWHGEYQQVVPEFLPQLLSASCQASVRLRGHRNQGLEVKVSRHESDFRSNVGRGKMEGEKVERR